MQILWIILLEKLVQVFCQMGGFGISNFKALGSAILQFNFTVFLLMALNCYNPIPNLHLHYGLCFRVAALKLHQRWQSTRIYQNYVIHNFILTLYLQF